MKPITDPNESKKNYKSIKKNIFPNKAAIDHGVLDESKTYATRLGVGDIGFAKVKPEMIFKGKEISYDNAIVFLMEMKRKEINQAPSLNTQKEIFRTYYALGKIINMLANFMRKKGYNVQAGPALDGDVNYPVLAEEAGLGAIGKHGLLINPKFGPSLRIATLY
ncbi:MAG: [Fe-S]-binding protein, partial [Candidatus Brocadiaceae bacterium]|nr:[Fe-S]-binding protein [Candidatus Brocadiaceae bacterium]